MNPVKSTFFFVFHAAAERDSGPIDAMEVSRDESIHRADVAVSPPEPRKDRHEKHEEARKHIVLTLCVFSCFVWQSYLPEFTCSSCAVNETVGMVLATTKPSSPKVNHRYLHFSPDANAAFARSGLQSKTDLAWPFNLFLRRCSVFCSGLVYRRATNWQRT